jgi:hypothetical protein
LANNYVEVCRQRMLSDKAIGITYTGLVYFSDEHPIDTGKVQLTPFDWELQAKGGIPPATCIPCASMFRKSMWSRTGGYKQKYAPAEDTEFWVNGLATGYLAEVASLEGLFYYRGHSGSASRTRKYGEINDNKPWMTDKHYPFAAPSKTPSLIRSYSEPVIRFIIEVKEGQEKTLANAIDSLLAQKIREWEVAVVGKVPYDVQMAFPFISSINQPSDAALFIAFQANNTLRPDAIERFSQAVMQSQNISSDELFNYPEGVDMSKCCGGNADAILEAKRALGIIPRETTVAVNLTEMVKMRFTGERKGPVGYSYPVGRKITYYGANNEENRFVMAYPEHVELMVKSGYWEIAR